MIRNRTPRSRRLARCGAIAAVALALFGTALPAASANPAARGAVAAKGGTPCGRVDVAPMVTIPVGKSSVIRPEVAVKRILLGNPENAQAARPSAETVPAPAGMRQAKQDEGRPGVAQVDVLLLSPNEIYLLGKTVGSTNIVLVDRAGGCTALDITVGMDVSSVQGALATLLPEETEIKVNSAYDSLVLTGTVADATKVARAVEIAAAYVGGSDEEGRNQRVLNMLQVGAPQQVMLEVKVAEISKTLLERIGMRVARADRTGGWSYTLLSDFLTGGNGLLDLLHNSNGDRITIDGQKDDGLIKVLAEPNVMAISGQEGSFLSGGKIFIPVAQSNTLGGGQTITLEEKEFGVALKFTPTVLSGGRINLRVAPEVSELNREGIGISAPGVNGQAILPSFTTRRAMTTVQLNDGQSFAIGGLIKNNVMTNIQAFPFLGEIPVLGALFRSSDFQTDRSELVFVITPRLVKPLPADYRLPTDDYIQPSRSDLFLMGRMEGTPPAPASPAPGEPAASSPGEPAAPVLPAAPAPARPEAAQGGFEPQ